MVLTEMVKTVGGAGGAVLETGLGRRSPELFRRDCVRLQFGGRSGVQKEFGS